MAVANLVFGNLTIPPAAALNSARPRPLAAAGARSLVPLTYGEERVAALILNVLISAADANVLLVQCLWGHACHQIDELRLNDEALPAGSSVTSYTGSQVTADAALVAAFAAQSITYTDTLAGYAYSVVAMPVKAFDGQLNISARVRGRKLYDPRLDSTLAGGSGSHRLATPATWAYSDNPALALADWLYSAAYGAGEAVNWLTVQTAANACDAMIGSPAEKRRLIGLTLTAATALQTQAEMLRAYAGCWLVPSAGGMRLLPDADAAAAASYSHASGQIASIEPLTLRDLGNSPTAVEVVYTDTAQIPWREASATATLAGAGMTLPWRLSSVRMPGVQRYSQAMREATERLNKLSLEDRETSLEVFDSGIAHDVADIVEVTHPLGLSAQTFRVTGVEMPGPGRWRLTLAEHDPAVYSTAVATVTPPADSSRTAPAGPPENVAGLAGSVTNGLITWVWTAATAPDYAETRLRVGGTDWASAAPLWNGRANAYAQQVTATGTVTVRAKHVTRTGAESAAATSAAVVVTGGGLPGGYVPDPTAPPTPTGLAVTAGLGHLYIEHDAPAYTEGHGHRDTVVYGAQWPNAAPEPVFADAAELMTFAGTVGAYPSPTGTRWCVWIKWRSIDGYLSATAAGGTHGAQATTGKIGTTDLGPLVVEAGNLAGGAVTAAKLAAGAVELTAFAAGLQPVQLVTGVPGSFTGIATLYDQTTDKLYRWNGAAYVATVPATDLTGQITETQITDGAVSTPKLVAGAVTTAKLAAGAVTANELAADSVVAGKVAAGAISTAQLAAGAVTTDKLLVTGAGPALNSDPNTRDGSAWEASGAIAFTPDVSPTGFAIYCTAPTVSVTSLPFPLDASRNHLARAFIQQLSGSSTAYLLLAFYDATGTLLAGSAYPTGWPSAGTYHYFGVTGTVPPGSYTEYRIAFGPGETAQIPPGAVSCRIGALLNYAGGTSQQRITGLRVERKADADLIVDGAIVASKIAANAIAVGTAAIQNGAIVNAMIADAAIDNAKVANLSAAKINAGTLDAARIAAGSITAAKLSVSTLAAITADLGTITAGNITLDTAGFIKGGSSAFNTGDGFWLGYTSGNWKMSIKSGSSSIVLDPAAALPITFTGQVFGSMTISGVTSIGGSIAHGSNILLGTRTASVSGGTGPLRYQWYLSSQRNDPVGMNIFLTGSQTATCSVWVTSAAYDDETDTEVVCVVTDANGRTAVATMGVGVVFT